MSTNTAEKFYRLTNESELHRGLQYHDGLNVDPVNFSPTGSCSAGGMYFFSREELVNFYNYVSPGDAYWIREVTLPAGARVYLEDGKRKADRFILGPRERFCVHEFFTAEQRLTAVKQDVRFIQYIKVPTSAERLAAVTQDGYFLMFIEDPTAEERLAAVNQNGCVIRYIKNPSAEERLTAVKQDGRVIQFISDPTAEERLASDKWKAEHGVKTT